MFGIGSEGPVAPERPVRYADVVRTQVKDVLDRLLAASEAARSIGLDDVGDAVGAMAITPAEIEELVDALEAAGRRVVAPEGGGGEKRLGVVLTAARALRGELGRTPSRAEIAKRTGLSDDDVRRALLLADVIRR